MVAIVVGGCGASSNLVTGTFDGGKLIALDQWVGNSVGTNIAAYADVPDQTPGNLEINGPQHWRCVGVFRTPTYVPPTGGLFQSDQDRMRDKALTSRSLVLTGFTAPGIGFAGPPGTYRVTIEVPGQAVKFSHTWTFGGPQAPPWALYRNAAACTQIADTLAQQRSIADQYLSALQDWLGRASPSPVRTQLQALLDQARQAKVSGDGQADAAQRTASYQSAAETLKKMARLAADPASNALSRSDVYNITNLATGAAALLLQTGLS
jgi:hypothetical protein